MTIDRQSRILQKQRQEKNRHMSYNPIIMVCIFLLAPLMIIPFSHRWFSPGLEELRANNYKRMYFQRLMLLIGGVLFYIFLLVYDTNRNEQERQRAIDRVDITEEKRNYQEGDTSINGYHR